MQTDQAGWHKSNDLKVPENIRLLPQPSHSPELNPVEHLWDELREKNLNNRAFETIEDTITAVCEGIRFISNDKKRLTSMTNFPHLRVIC